MGMNDINSLAHSKWNCKYHIVFAPKYRRKVFYKAKRAAPQHPDHRHHRRRRGNLRPGDFRKEPGKLGLPPQEISRILTDLLRTYERTPTDLDQILSVHITFEQIHPFADYNGRLGRILMLKESFRHEITPFIFPDKSRGAYNRSIRDNAPEELQTITALAQDRFTRKEEVCRLMRYRRMGR